jgi:hypothetical protein
VQATENVHNRMGEFLEELSLGNVAVELPHLSEFLLMADILGVDLLKLPLPGRFYMMVDRINLPLVFCGFQPLYPAGHEAHEAISMLPALPQSLEDSSRVSTQWHIDEAEGRVSARSRPTRKARARPSEKFSNRKGKVRPNPP